MHSYTKDNRLHIEEMYKRIGLLKKYFKEHELYMQKSKTKESVNLPIYAFTSRKKGPALWIIAGIHGEEPAGPNALAESIDIIKSLSKKIPVVVLPLCNPQGYRKNWRYPYFPKKPRALLDLEIPSVGSSEHYLLGKDNKPRRKTPVCEEAAAISKFVVEKSKAYPPKLVIDLHEDESLRSTYIYVHSDRREKDPVAKEVIRIMRENKVRLERDKKTRFGETIINGMCINAHDSSIDELLSSKKIIVNDKIVKGPSCPTVIVIETITPGIPLKNRVKVHKEILESCGYLWKIK